MRIWPVLLKAGWLEGQGWGLEGDHALDVLPHTQKIKTVNIFHRFLGSSSIICSSMSFIGLRQIPQACTMWVFKHVQVTTGNVFSSFLF
jgi:hypothetical protein